LTSFIIVFLLGPIRVSDLTAGFELGIKNYYTFFGGYEIIRYFLDKNYLSPGVVTQHHYKIYELENTYILLWLSGTVSTIITAITSWLIKKGGKH
jgi:hypothetical protein